MALFCNTLDVSIVPAAVIICPLGLHWVNDLPVSCRRTLMSHKHVENCHCSTTQTAFRFLAGHVSTCARAVNRTDSKPHALQPGRAAEQFPVLKAPGGGLLAVRQPRA